MSVDPVSPGPAASVLKLSAVSAGSPSGRIVVNPTSGSQAILARGDWTLRASTSSGEGVAWRRSMPTQRSGLSPQGGREEVKRGGAAGP